MSPFHQQLLYLIKLLTSCQYLFRSFFEAFLSASVATFITIQHEQMNVNTLCIFYKSNARTQMDANPGTPRIAISSPDAMLTGTYIPRNPAAIFIANKRRNENARRNHKTGNRSNTLRTCFLFISNRRRNKPTIKMTTTEFTGNAPFFERMFHYMQLRENISITSMSYFCLFK